MSSLNIGLSALRVTQRQLELVGQNIANANTPGYRRKEAILESAPGGSADAGLGVSIKEIRRLSNDLLENAIVRNNSEASDVATQSSYMNQVETLLAPGQGSLQDLVEKFFNEAQRLSSRPDDLTQRRVTLNLADQLADRFNSTIDSFKQINADLNVQANRSVDSINSLASQVAKFNMRIASASINGADAGDLLDKRDYLIKQLAQEMDIRVVPQDFGSVNILAGGTPLVLANDVYKLQFNFDGKQGTVTRVGSSQPIDLQGGRLAGLTRFLNSTLPAVKSQFDQFSQTLIQNLDEVHGRGLGLDGPMTFLSANRAAPSSNQPLGLLNLSYPPQKGTMTITVTNLADGSKKQGQIAFDPAVDSLNSVAAKIAAIPNMQAVVDTQSGLLKILAKPGYGFDFSGTMSTTPDAQSWTGTAGIKLGGAYTGKTNDTYAFKVIGSGTVGVTPGLKLEVRNSANAIVGSVDIGQGYSPGTDLPNVDGVVAKLQSGTVASGDTFSVNVVADSDSAYLISALGLNSFFTGDPTQGLNIRPDLLSSPGGFALSATGQPADSGNLARIIALRDQRAFNSGSQNYGQFLTDMVTQVGAQVSDNELRSTALNDLGKSLDAQNQAFSGVDPNEELARMLNFQRGFQMASRYIVAVNQTMDELFNLVR
ncbi:MAG: flagellar hook-associated protein FlgK [Gemmataceae bacterium]|nr:flagellar hook-associated protein FlgK [Gemmataceae bacterium]